MIRHNEGSGTSFWNVFINQKQKWHSIQNICQSGNGCNNKVTQLTFRILVHDSGAVNIRNTKRAGETVNCLICIPTAFGSNPGTAAGSLSNVSPGHFERTLRSRSRLLSFLPHWFMGQSIPNHGAQCAQFNFVLFCTAVLYSKVVSPKINSRTFCRSCSLISTLQLRLTHEIIIDCTVLNASYGVSTVLCSFHIKMLTKIISFLCFVDRVSLYNLVNKANLVHKFS
jgi:hypothetical protein